ncbi:hypothetical protein LWF15_27500 [Kineosporia rhizophila]|uniref:helix-turn-helix domain-containing protein n=1 Tax=Kineosporia TaxID=49184 RepID=UPI000A89CA65|nr:MULTISPECIES: hypothetical protein [Kineosporia]MCE0539250.1 hypothetical protein [Kineosporia rhizophila]GLY14479.1 hypothetical protein Kisp01_14940 [Kineosporia sp. NBRC 101677]
MPAASGNARRLAHRLKELRENRPGLTQTLLASALGTDKPVASATLSSWESVNNPKAPTAARLEAYARFFATTASFDGRKARLPSASELRAVPDVWTEYERLHAELVELLQADEPEPEEEGPRQRILLDYDDGDIVIVCPDAPADARGPLAADDSPNYTLLHQFADTDALIEVFGHIRALNPSRKVFYRTSDSVSRSEIQNHLVLLGGIGWSRTTRRLLSMLDLPVEQIEHPDLTTGEVFRLAKSVTSDEKVFFPVADEQTNELIEDVALIARVANPFNSNRTLTILNGIHSRGVLGAALAVTDETIRAGNQEYLAERFPEGNFALLMRVPVIQGKVIAPDFKNDRARLFAWSQEESEQ